MCGGLWRSGRPPCPLRRNRALACSERGPSEPLENPLEALAAEPKRTRAHGGGLRGAAVHLALGHGGQLLDDRFFLVESLLKQGRAVLATELLRPGDQRTV